MDNNNIISRLRFHRTALLEQLGQQIAHTEEISTVIQLLLGGEVPHPATFPPNNPFQGVPQQRIDHEMYLRIVRTLISDPGNTPKELNKYQALELQP